MHALDESTIVVTQTFMWERTCIPFKTDTKSNSINCEEFND